MTGASVYTLSLVIVHDDNMFIVISTWVLINSKTVMTENNVYTLRLVIISMLTACHCNDCRFVVLRTKTSVTVKEAQQMATEIENFLGQRIVHSVLKQR